MILLKISINDWTNASHDQRELSVCRDLGMDVKVLAKGKKGDKGRIDYIDGFEVHRMTSRPLRRVPISVNRMVSIFTWAKYARSLHPDIISGHDLSGLVIGWIAGVFTRKDKRPRFVYDSHEFEIGRNAKRNRMQIFLIKHLERFMIKKSEFTIVVNDSIADELVKVHKLKKRPVVVRNTPNLWQVDSEVCKSVRKDILAKLGGGYLLIYVGNICRGRGIEQAIEVTALEDEFRLLIIGKVESSSYKEKLKHKIQKLNVEKKILFHPAVNPGELWKYIGAADVSLVLIQDIGRSYYLSLPNKLFESILSYTPVIGSDFPEIKRMIAKYDIGEICNPENIDDIHECIMKLKKDMNRYRQCKKNEEKASKELCWELESRKLRDAYEKLCRSLL